MFLLQRSLGTSMPVHRSNVRKVERVPLMFGFRHSDAEHAARGSSAAAATAGGSSNVGTGRVGTITPSARRATVGALLRAHRPDTMRAPSPERRRGSTAPR